MYRSILFSLFLIISTISSGQEEWSLERCVLHALENNLAINQGEVSVDFADIDLKQNKHARYPSLNASTNLNSNFGRTIDPVTNEFITEAFVSNGLSLSSGITVFNGFRIANSIKQSKILKTAAEQDLEQTKRDIILQVANVYLNVLFAEENLEIAQSQLATSEEQLVQTQKLINAGVRPANEALDIEAQIATNEQSIITAENNKVIALLNLKQLLRIEPDVEMSVVAPTNIDGFSDPDALTFKEVYKSALNSQPNVHAAEMRVESAKVGEKISKSGLLPSVSVGGSIGSNYSNQGRTIDGFTIQTSEQDLVINGMPATIETTQEVPNFVDNPYFDQMDENLSYGVGLSVNVPIYNNRNVKSNIERSKLNIINSEIQRDQLKDALKTTVQQALADARAAKRRKSATEKSVNAQRASFENAEKRFNAGAINTFEYVSIKNALQQAEVNAIIAKYEYIFALKVLDFYMGKPITID